MSFQLAVLYEWRTKLLEPALADVYAGLDVEKRRKVTRSRVATILRCLGVARDPKSAGEAYHMLATEYAQGAETNHPVLEAVMAELYRELGPPSAAAENRIQHVVCAVLDKNGAGLADVEEYAGAAVWWRALRPGDCEPSAALPKPATGLDAAADNAAAPRPSTVADAAFAEDDGSDNEGAGEDAVQQSDASDSGDYEATPPPKAFKPRNLARSKRAVESDAGDSDEQTKRSKKSDKKKPRPTAWRMTRFKFVTDRPAHKALEFDKVDMYSVLQQPEFHGIRSVNLAYWKIPCQNCWRDSVRCIFRPNEDAQTARSCCNCYVKNSPCSANDPKKPVDLTKEVGFVYAGELDGEATFRAPSLTERVALLTRLITEKKIAKWPTWLSPEGKLLDPKFIADPANRIAKAGSQFSKVEPFWKDNGAYQAEHPAYNRRKVENIKAGAGPADAIDVDQGALCSFATAAPGDSTGETSPAAKGKGKVEEEPPAEGLLRADQGFNWQDEKAPTAQRLDSAHDTSDTTALCISVVALTRAVEKQTSLLDALTAEVGRLHSRLDDNGVRYDGSRSLLPPVRSDAPVPMDVDGEERPQPLVTATHAEDIAAPAACGNASSGTSAAAAADDDVPSTLAPQALTFCTPSVARLAVPSASASSTPPPARSLENYNTSERKLHQLPEEVQPGLLAQTSDTVLGLATSQPSSTLALQSTVLPFLPTALPPSAPMKSFSSSLDTLALKASVNEPVQAHELAATADNLVSPSARGCAVRLAAISHPTDLNTSSQELAAATSSSVDYPSRQHPLEQSTTLFSPDPEDGTGRGLLAADAKTDATPLPADVVGDQPAEASKRAQEQGLDSDREAYKDPRVTVPEINDSQKAVYASQEEEQPASAPQDGDNGDEGAVTLVRAPVERPPSAPSVPEANSSVIANTAVSSSNVPPSQPKQRATRNRQAQSNTEPPPRRSARGNKQAASAAATDVLEKAAPSKRKRGEEKLQPPADGSNKKKKRSAAT